MKLDRRQLLAGGVGATALSGCAHLGTRTPPSGIVKRQNAGFVRAGEPYRVTGANMWYAAWLGADAPFGNRPRLGRELDRLKALGINNLRIMASASEGPLDHSLKIGFTHADGSPNPLLFGGLDYAMAEIAKRGMTAALVLGSFWEWSGGMQTMLWRATGKFMNMGDPAHPWPQFADSTAHFYSNPTARGFYDAHMRRVVTRTNNVTGQSYARDPAIFSWQLANEPRPGGSDAAIARNADAYCDWIDSTTASIRTLDPHHMVSLGMEGTIATNGNTAIVLRAQRQVDYCTAHIWPLNWGWAKGDDLVGTWPTVVSKTNAYIATEEQLAAQLDKPLVIEEFGFPRDGDSYSPSSGTTFRQRFYRLIYGAVEDSWRTGGPLVGSNFWAWSGEARAEHPDYRFRPGDTAYMGDPPHEPQGWYGNFDTDSAMLAVIRANASQRCLGLDSTCTA